MHTFWLALLVPGMAMIVMASGNPRWSKICSVSFWLALAGSFAFFGYDIIAYMEQLNDAKDIGLRVIWKFLISNGIPLIQLTTAFGFGWLVARTAKSSSEQ